MVLYFVRDMILDSSVCRSGTFPIPVTLSVSADQNLVSALKSVTFCVHPTPASTSLCIIDLIPFTAAWIRGHHLFLGNHSLTGKWCQSCHCRSRGNYAGTARNKGTSLPTIFAINQGVTNPAPCLGFICNPNHPTTPADSAGISLHLN